jgi:hypothetical protein
MTLEDAITALLEEYHLGEFEDLIRDEVKAEPTFDGLSVDHPRVRRFRDVVHALRVAVDQRQSDR